MNGANGTIRYMGVSNDFKYNLGEKSIAFYFAEDLIYFLLLLPAVLLFLCQQKASSAAFWSTPLLPAGFLLFTICRMKPHRVWQSVLLTFLSAAGCCTPLLAADNYLSAAAAFCGMIISLRRAAYDFHRKYERTVDHNSRFGRTVYRKRTISRDERSDDDSSPAYFGTNVTVFSGVLCLLFYFAALALGFRRLALFCIADFAVVFAAMKIYRQKSGAYCLSQWNRLSGMESSPNIAGASEAGGSLLAFLSAGVAGVVAGSVFLAAWLDGNFGVDSAILQKLGSLFDAVPKSTTVTMPETKPMEQSSLLKKLMEQKEDSWPYAEIIGAVLKVVLWCAAAAAAVLLLVFLGSAVLRLLKQLNMDANEESRSLLFTGQKTAVPGKSFFSARKPGWGFRRGNRAAIRRLFFLHVKHHRTAAVKSSDTPSELGRKTSGARDIEKAANLYEKARYSAGTCGVDDVRAMKQALKPGGRPD